MRKAWSALPWDGQGWRAPADADLAGLRRAAAARFWRRLPWWSRLALVPASHLLWPLAAAARTVRFTRARLPAPVGWRVFADCVLGGAHPVDAWAWRALVAAAPHPLPHRSAAAVLTGLGDPAAHLLLRDKLATAGLLRAAGIPTPETLAQLPAGTAPDRCQPPWNGPAALFIKPRAGAAGCGTMAVDVLQGGRCRLSDGTVVDVEQLRTDREMLVQPRLAAAPDLADLAAAGPAPVLRLTTARTPGGLPFLHSALLSMAVPGRRPEAFLRGHLWAAVEPASATLTAGVILGEPARRHARLPWNGAPLAGRLLPGFAAASELALQAMTLLPGLPLATWDIIPTADGPVFLEGNSAGNWLLTNLAQACGLAPPPLPPLLRLWAGAI
ncbi:MAG TPA: sugar-transfer associated ATP-grasp domain-containing protein [Magnetospirillum sp.]|nr:sugar-transfer associated ATP-grasp domain-containing protein [Magnetospirillum sp.]